LQRKETAIEVKVGALVLLSLILFAGFVFVLGDFRIGQQFYIYVDLENAGGLKPGADVRVAGLPAGGVDRIDFMGGHFDEEVGYNVYVRARLSLSAGMADSIGRNATLVITTLGVLGEPYVEIVNATPPGDPVEEGHIFLGEAPIRTDQIIRAIYSGLRGLDGLIDTVDTFFQESDLNRLLTEASDLASHLDEVIVDNRESLAGTFRSLDIILEENRDALPPIFENVEGATAQFEILGRSLNRALGDGSDLRDTIRNLENVTDELSDHGPAIFEDLEAVMASLRAALADNEQQLANTIDNVEGITENFLVASADVAEMIAYINDGRGTIGGLIRDDEIFDDLRELIRELKRRPWRLIWKE
jgi:phospholipid/cholesterol/gamma-HCH transport system substrate-binding protein